MPASLTSVLQSTSPFVVLKFGGTSVATAARWHTIAAEAQKRLDEGLRPVIVCSAMTRVSDTLEKLVHEAVGGRHEPLLAQLRARHAELAEALDLPIALLDEDFAELERLALGASLLRDSSPRIKARTMAIGELLSTRLGAAFLSARGLATSFVDARTCFVSDDDPAHPERRRVLSATVSDDRDPALAARFQQLGTQVIVTQGFIARDPSGGTVLLGRGGSDTSAAYFAAKLHAVRCEIWTDVPGIFTADPRLIPTAMVLRQVGYGEAQEVASMGAKVLHPRCIAPCRRHRIPIHLRWTERPSVEGTIIAKSERSGESQVKAICHKRGVTLISMETTGMWQQVGFLADVFGCFKARGVSCDLVSTSEMNITVSLDAAANQLDPATLDGLVQDLGKLCRAKVIGGCAAVSLVGRRIRAILHKLGSVLSVFEEQKIHLVSQAASDLNLTFVVDEEQAERLVRSLHALLFSTRKPDATVGVSWRELFEEKPAARASDPTLPWWRERRDALLALAAKHSPLYVYDEETLDRSIAALRGLTAVDRVFYALKANPNGAVLTSLDRAGFGFECVSPGEIAAVRTLLPHTPPERILFTPNFAPKHEYAAALALNVVVTVDNIWILERWPELFAGRSIFLRLDPGTGRGHHDFVKTGGQQSKFGIAVGELEKVHGLLTKCGARVIGLHAHAGSGVLDAHAWSETALFLVTAAQRFPDVTTLDLGGGLGVPEEPGQPSLDLAALDASLHKVKHAHPRFSLWLEPGRFVVAQAGALLGRVAQVKTKGQVTFVGTDAGMNSLIRPALYGAYHEIVNLSRLDEQPTMTAQIVGPICESGDVLGHARRIAPAREGDVLLVGTTGAYGRAMSSHYNLREPATEHFLAARSPTRREKRDAPEGAA